MKRLLLVLAMACASLGIQAQVYDDFRVFVGNILLNNKNYTNNEVSSLYNHHYNISEQKLNSLYIGFNKNWGDVALGIEMSRFLNLPINTIYSDYKEYGGTLGWGALAKKHGIKPGSDEFHRLKQRMNNKSTYWRNTCNEYKTKKNPNVAGKKRDIYPNELMKSSLPYNKQKEQKNKYKNYDNKSNKANYKEKIIKIG